MGVEAIMARAFPWAGHSRLAEGAARPSAKAGSGQADASRFAAAELPYRRLAIVLGLFSAISAITGGVALVVWRAGNQYLLPLRLLAHTPFTSFLAPGLILAIVVGGTNLVCGILAWRRSRAAVDAMILAGGTLTVWILAEIAMLRSVHWLHGIYGIFGAAILFLGVRAAWRSHLPRHRWVISVTIAEAIGFLVPACAGIFSTRAGLRDLPQAGLVVAAGLVEGIALGAGQAWAFPLPVRRLRYALLTALGAGVVWASVMSMTQMVESEAVPPAFVGIIGVTTALIGLAAIGSAQWIELRHHTPAARCWIPWTALAWIIALPLSFTPAPFVDESTPIGAHLELWGCAGLLMAHVMALITWQGARRLRPRNTAQAMPASPTERRMT
jgi:hypothetical protein